MSDVTVTLDIPVDDVHAEMLEVIDSDENELDGDEWRMRAAELISGSIENSIHNTYQQIK